jgi:hypothetical protein
MAIFANYQQADIISYTIHRLDVQCRTELVAGTIISERDYVSALTTRVRDSLNGPGWPGNLWCHAQTLPSSDEQQFGVDAMIVFRSGLFVKVGVFEAKRPQVRERDAAWDRINNGISHFSEQIQKQRQIQESAAVWELFMVDCDTGDQSPPFDTFGSSCVWHRSADEFMRKENLISSRWTTDKLRTMVQHSNGNLYYTIFEILSCSAGRRFPIERDDGNYFVQILNEESGSIMNLPLPSQPNFEQDDRIAAFMAQIGIRYFTFINVA